MTEGSDLFRADAFAGKTVFVAGGSSGINLAIAQRFAAAGARVALISRSEERIKAAAETILAAGGEAIGMAADVRDYAAIDDAFHATTNRFGVIDVVVSGAAGNFLTPAI